MTLGSVYQQTGKYERSMQYFNDALTRSRELKLPLEEYIPRVPFRGCKESAK
jgi:hypothetical protein